MAHPSDDEGNPDRPPDPTAELNEPAGRLENVRGFGGCLLLLVAAGIIVIWPAAVIAGWLDPQSLWPALLTLVLIGFAVWALTRGPRG